MSDTIPTISITRGLLRNIHELKTRSGRILKIRLLFFAPARIGINAMKGNTTDDHVVNGVAR